MYHLNGRKLWQRYRMRFRLHGVLGVGGVLSVFFGALFWLALTDQAEAASTAPYWEKNGSMIFYNDGNVGINNNSPKTRLHANGGFALGNNSAILGGAGRSIELATDTSFGGVHNQHTGIRMFSYDMNGWGSAKLGIQVSNGWRSYYGGNVPTKDNMAMVVGQHETLIRGNLGIGTVSPGRRLEVGNGGVRMRGSGNTYVDFNPFGGGTNNTEAILDINAAPANNTSAGYLRLFRSTNTSGPVGLSVLRGDGTATTNAHISGKGNSFLAANNGNVGIGTTAPGVKLQVNGGIRARGGAPGPNGQNNNGYAFSGNNGDNDSGMFSPADGTLDFYANNQLKMRITDGDICIGKCQ